MLPGELHRNHLLCEIAVPYNLAPRSGVGAAAWRHLAGYRLQPVLACGPRGVVVTFASLHVGSRAVNQASAGKLVSARDGTRAAQNPHPGIPGTTSRRSYR